MRQPRNNGVGSFGARGSAPPIWQRRSVHLLVGASIVIIGLLAMFGRAEQAGAQEAKPDKVRVTLTAKEGTTCRGLAETFTGTELECGSLISENPWLRVSSGERIDIGDELLLPILWNRRVLDNSAGHVISVQKIVEQPVVDVINNSGFGWPVLLIAIGLTAVLFFVLGVAGLLVFVRAPGVAEWLRKVSILPPKTMPTRE